MKPAQKCLLLELLDGVEALADGRGVVKVRVRAIADGGQANRALKKE